MNRQNAGRRRSFRKSGKSGKRRSKGIRRRSKRLSRGSNRRLSNRRSKCNRRLSRKSCNRKNKGKKKCSWIKRKSKGKRKNKAYCRRMSGGSSENVLTPEQKNQLIGKYNEIEKELVFGNTTLDTEYTDLESDVIGKYNIIHKLDYLAYLSIKKDVDNLNNLSHYIWENHHDKKEDMKKNREKRLEECWRVLDNPEERYNYFESSLYAWQDGDKSDPNNLEIKIDKNFYDFITDYGYKVDRYKSTNMLESFPQLLIDYGINRSEPGITKKAIRDKEAVPHAEKAAKDAEKAAEEAENAAAAAAAQQGNDTAGYKSAKRNAVKAKKIAILAKKKADLAKKRAIESGKQADQLNSL